MDTGLAFFVYKRPEHTQAVINSIVQNTFKHIYIFQDGLRDEKDRNAWEEVSRVVSQLKHIPDVHVELFISKTNKGLADSIVSGIEYVLSRHETVIALEDDVVMSKNYHRFAAVCFEKYREVPKVMSICGAGAADLVVDDSDYINAYPYDVYFTYGGTSVAFGTWRDRWRHYKRGHQYAVAVLADAAKCDTIKTRGGAWLLGLLRTVVHHPKEIDTWATFWALAEVLAGGVAVIPFKALAHDIGRDGSGTNTRERTTRYETLLHDMPEELRLPSPEEIFVDPYLVARQDIVINSMPSLMGLKLWILKMKRRFG